MMVAERDIPLWELRNKFLDNQHIKLRQILYKEDELKPLEHKHKVLLAKIKIAAMGEPCISKPGLPLKRHSTDYGQDLSMQWQSILIKPSSRHSPGPI